MLARAKARAKADKGDRTKPTGGITYPLPFIDDVYPGWRRNNYTLPGDWLDHDPRLIADLWWWHDWHEWSDEAAKKKQGAPPTQPVLEQARGINDL